MAEPSCAVTLTPVSVLKPFGRKPGGVAPVGKLIIVATIVGCEVDPPPPPPPLSPPPPPQALSAKHASTANAIKRIGASDLILLLMTAHTRLRDPSLVFTLA